MKWLEKFFPVQSRESEIEDTVHNCVNAIINSSNEYGPEEQLRIAIEVKNKIRSVLENEHLEILNDLHRYEKVLQIED
ncbi:hypothetical protein [Flagellimonas nanhaiensis]|uniref:Uncharacterized protein n=1 Tax=Flagellimonas nanhaiensis TaxID=2292706 RepID=A0A371JMV0_9FLAO|nr:hypothetical protein [Allomuricauda nanhaiensis]RDY58469.1 hypothetical protein DX873_15830 [Allomuricauda nanhaiensis]